MTGDSTPGAPRSRAMSLVAAAMGLLMAFGAVVQYNDPDPWAWIVIYIAAAGVSFQAVGAPGAWRPAAGVAAVAAIWAVTLLPAAARTSFPDLFQSWEMMSTEMEEGRELGGLLLIVAWTGFLAIRGRTVRQRPPDLTGPEGIGRTRESPHE